MNGAVFSQLYDLVTVPVLASTDAMIAAMAGWIGGVLKVALAAFITGRLLWQAHVQTNEPINEVTKQIVLAGLALMLVSVASYGIWARDVLLNGLAPDIGRALAGAMGNRPVTGAMFDELWGKAFAAGLAVYRALPWSIAGLGLCFVVIFYWLGAAIAILLSFLVWIKAFLILAVLVGLGPIFAALWVFPLFRGLALGWLNVVLSGIVLQILVVALLALLMSAETQLIALISYHVGRGASGNEIVAIQYLFAGLMLFGTAGWLVYQLPGTASAITGGFAGYGMAVGRFLQTSTTAEMPERHSGATRPPSQQLPAPAAPPARPPAPGRSMSNGGP